MANQEEEASQLDDSQKLELTLPRERGYMADLVFYKGFWCLSFILHNVIALPQTFQPQESDIIIASRVKCGTTWLKSLVFSIVHRNRFTKMNHPLLTYNPHQLVRTLELNNITSQSSGLLASRDPYVTNKNPNLVNSESEHDNALYPRISSTHIPFKSLPESIQSSSCKCKVVYIGRNPFDTAVSFWKFSCKIRPNPEEQMCFEDYVEKSCKGIEPFGPFWDHLLGYWKESLERPEKVLFLKYEDMQENGVEEMKKLAKFLGCGFTQEEESQGVIEEILELCSLNNLKNLEVNKTGSHNTVFKNSAYFRKGEVGDWVNHFSPELFERLDQVVKDKFADSGLAFKMYAQN